SVVQTGVKSLGCEKSTAHESPIQSWNWMVPSVVSAWKSGAVAPSGSAMRVLLRLSVRGRGDSRRRAAPCPEALLQLLKRIEVGLPTENSILRKNVCSYRTCVRRDCLSAHPGVRASCGTARAAGAGAAARGTRAGGGDGARARARHRRR